MATTQRKPRTGATAEIAPPSIPSELHLTRASFRRIVRDLADVLDPLDRLIDHYETFKPGANDQERCISVSRNQRMNLVLRSTTFENLRAHIGSEAAGKALYALPLFYRGHRLTVQPRGEMSLGEVGG